MAEPPLTLRPATERDRDAIIYLLDEAPAWLRSMNTDQWAKPWRTEDDRRERVTRDLRAGKTWIVEDTSMPVATFTADREHNHQEIPVWPRWAQRERAVYVCRLAVRHSYSGRQLGAALLDWIALTARERDGARYIRVDVWSTNRQLQSYYERLGFKLHSHSRFADYPSGALYQKPTRDIVPQHPPMFRVLDAGEAS
ncbi:MAG: GNAT family N-acetyltransferase [Streptosporangiales bacterium]